jgi:hypothetical protein
MKGYGSCALFITISDFRGPPKRFRVKVMVRVIIKVRVRIKVRVKVRARVRVR